MADNPYPKGTLMAGKRGLVMGVANKNSIAWAIAQQLAAQGAEIAFTYQGEALLRRVKPLAESLFDNPILVECDVTDDDTMDNTFATLADKWGSLDFLVHAIAFAGKDQLAGSFVDNTTREGFKAGIGSGRHMFRFNKAASAMQDNTESKGVAGAALYLLSDLGTSCTGETHHVDGGFHAIGMPQEEALRASLDT